MDLISGADAPRRFLFIVLATMVPVMLLMGLTGAIKADSESTGPVCEQAPNKVPNPGFETGSLESWSYSDETKEDCQYYEDDSSAYEGTYAAKIDPKRLTRDPCVLFTDLGLIEVEPLRSYDFSTWITGSPGADAYLAITFWEYDGSWRIVGDPTHTPVVTDTAGSWVRVAGSAQAPEGAEFARVEATLAEGAYSNVWFDKVYFSLATCLDITKQDNPHYVKPGDPLTYTIFYSNTGREAASGVVIEDIFDDYVQYQWADPEPVTVTSHTSTWELPGELAAGESGVITVVVEVDLEFVNHNWLINRVEIDAAEISSPITDTVYTGIDTAGVCAIDLHVVPESQSGNPGQTVDYNVELLNVGRFDGRAVLTATSDLDLKVELDLLSATLPVSDSVSTVMRLHVPSTVTIPSTDTTWISTTLLCDPDLMGDAREPVSTTVIYYSNLLPLTLRDYCSLDSWEVEDNDSCAEAYGPLCLDTEFFGYPDDAWDWFYGHVSEPGLLVELYTGSGEIPYEEGIQVALCTACIFGTPFGCQWGDPGNDYRIDAPALSGQFYIGIYKAGSYSTDWTYTLRVSPN